MYLIANRPNIMFSVGMWARFQLAPKESHLKAMKQILQYLKSTMHLVLWYPTGFSFNLMGFADADYAGYLINRNHIRDDSLCGTLPSFLGHKEAKFSCPLDCGS